MRTPAFMPVGTYGTVRGLTPRQIRECGTEIVLANAYHLALRPGTETIARLGGLHRFMGWKGPILTDSGGFQLFSLAAHVKVDDDGASIRSPLDGATLRLTPESVVRIEQELGVDVGMAFDVVTGEPSERAAAASAAARTLAWARRTRAEAKRGETTIFGITQGGLFEDLRKDHARALVDLDFEGYAVGGLSVGEARSATMETADLSAGLLPEDRPRYMMGMGTPVDLVELCGQGYDLFDCVMPTRNARNGTLLTRDGPLSIRNAEHGDQDGPVQTDCSCYTCGRFSRGYLHHLAKRKEMLGATLGSIHNVHFYQHLMAEIGEAIASDRYPSFGAAFIDRYTRGESS